MEGGASGSPGQCLWSSGRSAQQIAGELGGGLGLCPVYGSPGWRERGRDGPHHIYISKNIKLDLSGSRLWGSFLHVERI